MSINKILPFSKTIEIFLRSHLGMRFLIPLHFRVHIVDSSDGWQIHLADMHSKLHRSEQQERRRHFRVNRSKFFKLDLCLDIQSPKLDDLR